MAICRGSTRRVAPNAHARRVRRRLPHGGESRRRGLVRNLPTFSDFLDVAALSDGEIVNFSSIARECGVSSHTTKSHFQILEDTLLGRWLPGVPKATQAPGDSVNVQVLLRRRRRRESIGATRANPGRFGTVRQGLRELGVSRAVHLHELPRGGRPAVVLATCERYRGRLHHRRHASGDRGEVRYSDHTRSPQGAP